MEFQGEENCEREQLQEEKKQGKKKRKINWQKLLARDERQSFKPSLLGVSWQMP